MPMGITKKNLASRLKAIREKKPKRKASVGRKKKIVKKAKTVSTSSNGGGGASLTGAHPIQVHQRHDASKFIAPLRQPYDTPKFNTMNGMSRLTINTAQDEGAILIHFWNQSAYRLILTYTNNVTPPSIRHQLVDKLNCYNSELPQSARHLRAILKIRNVTRADQVAGIIRVLSCTEFPLVSINVPSTALPMQLSAESWTAIQNYVRGQQMTTTYTAAEMRSTMSFPLAPGHDIAHRSYLGFVDVTTGQRMKDCLDVVIGNEPVAPTVFLFEPNSNPQTYDISIHHQDACQYAATSALNLLAYAPTQSAHEQFEQDKKVLKMIATKGEYDRALKSVTDKFMAKRFAG